jgi:hypothetical protein
MNPAFQSAKFSTTEIGSFSTGCTGTGCVEVLAYDKTTKMTAVVLSTSECPANL